jgi:citrate synthase
MKRWIGSAEAAERLGVKPATLYAYVSRGLLHRRRDTDGRRSLFDPAEIDELAGRSRPRPGPDLRIESAITALGVDRPYYRGHDALALAGTHVFEEVAALLWSGELVAEAWEAAEDGVRAAVAAQSGLPAGVPPLDRLQVITATLAATDPLRFHMEPEAVAGTGGRLIAGMIDSLPILIGPPATTAAPARPPVGGGGASLGGRTGVADRLWCVLTSRAAEPGLVRALDGALVLLADHELAASTLAVRAAASARADPYAVVSTGLGALGGPMHGGASFAAERLLHELTDQARVPQAIGEWLRRGQRIPGLGHTVYKSGDGRATRLFELIGQAAPGHERLDLALAVVAEADERRLPAPNIDLALATLTAVCEMEPGAGEAIFAVARTAGWLAHALEEYEHGTLLRPRAIYTGPPIP